MVHVGLSWEQIGLGAMMLGISSELLICLANPLAGISELDNM